MNTRSRWPERALASGTRHGGLLPLTVVPSHFSLEFVKRYQRLAANFPRRCRMSFLVHGRSIAAEAARRHDGDEFIEIQFDDGLQGRGGGGIAQTIRHGVVPGGIFGLQAEQSCDRVVPALRAGAPVDWPPIADDRCCLFGITARSVASLAFGVAERVLTFGLLASGHGSISVT